MKDFFDKAHVVFFAIVVLVTIAFYATISTIATAMEQNGTGWVTGAWFIYASTVSGIYLGFRNWNWRDNGGRRY